MSSTANAPFAYFPSLAKKVFVFLSLPTPPLHLLTFLPYHPATNPILLACSQSQGRLEAFE